MAVFIYYYMKLYLLQGTKGSWDSFDKFNVGIYESYEKAEEEKQKIIEELTILSNKYSAKEVEKYDDEIDDLYDSVDVDKDVEIKLPDYLEEFRDWQYKYKFEEFNIKDFEIKEMKVNKNYFNIYGKAD